MASNKQDNVSNHDASKRKFLKTAATVAYVAPVVMSFPAHASRAKTGSCYEPAGKNNQVEVREDNHDRGDKNDKNDKNKEKNKKDDMKNNKQDNRGHRS